MRNNKDIVCFTIYKEIISADVAIEFENSDLNPVVNHTIPISKLSEYYSSTPDKITKIKTNIKQINIMKWKPFE